MEPLPHHYILQTQSVEAEKRRKLSTVSIFSRFFPEAIPTSPSPPVFPLHDWEGAVRTSLLPGQPHKLERALFRRDIEIRDARRAEDTTRRAGIAESASVEVKPACHCLAKGREGRGGEAGSMRSRLGGLMRDGLVSKGVGREGEGYEGSDGRRWWLREARSQGRREERKSCGKETDAGRR
jgi:hypothetical protein